MAAIQPATVARSSPERDSGHSGDLEKSDQSLTNDGSPSKEEHTAGITTTEASYTPQSDEEYNVTFKTWIVVWVSCSIVAIRTKAHERKDPSLVVRYLLLDCADLQRMYDRHRWGTRRRQPGCVVYPRLHHVRYDGFHVSAVSLQWRNILRLTRASRVCGANSDLFGRRWFIIGGNVLMFIGFITTATAKNNTSAIVGSAFVGFVRVDSPGDIWV